MNTNHATNQEQTVRVKNGWVMLILLGGALIAAIGSMAYNGVHQNGGYAVFSLFLAIVVIVLLTGFFTLQPNEACVLILFGAYYGTVRDNGFHWGNPFYS